MISGYNELRSIDQIILPIPNRIQGQKRGQVDYIESTWPDLEGIEVTLSLLVTYFISRQGGRVISK